MAGLYIHIPFCKSKCSYCGFYSLPNQEVLQSRYVSALGKELDIRNDYLGAEDVETIYIGGGTPSILNNENLLQLGEIISTHIQDLSLIKEFTIECNPNDITDELCQTLRAIGANRISMGVQTFSDSRLRFLGRRHKSNEIASAIALLRKHGFTNISIDLMFGFPDETIAEWVSDIEKAIALNVEHISAYSLMYEEDTPLYQMLKEGKIEENADEHCEQMYIELMERLSNAGYEHYEISNFALPNHQSLHNSSYWNGTKYIGIGAAAHSYDGESRQWNISSINDYISGVTSNNMKIEKEHLDEKTKYNDLITTALRTKKGIDLTQLSDDYYIYIKRNARKGIESGCLEYCDNHLRLTKKGLFISDELMSDLIYI